MIPALHQIAVRAVQPDDALLSAYMADDPSEFYRLIAEREAEEDDPWADEDRQS